MILELCFKVIARQGIRVFSSHRVNELSNELILIISNLTAILGVCRLPTQNYSFGRIIGLISSGYN